MSKCVRIILRVIFVTIILGLITLVIRSLINLWKRRGS